jgi:HK97 gp10 family phage protein
MAYKPTEGQQAVVVKGIADLSRALIAIGAPVKAIQDANAAVGVDVVRTARNIAPVRSGALRDTIKMGRATTNVKIRAGLKKVPYANPIHWGWFYDRNNFITKNIKPNPFMARALEYNRDDILKKYAEEMAKLIAKYEPPASVKRTW